MYEDTGAHVARRKWCGVVCVRVCVCGVGVVAGVDVCVCVWGAWVCVCVCVRGCVSVRILLWCSASPRREHNRNMPP